MVNIKINTLHGVATRQRLISPDSNAKERIFQINVIKVKCAVITFCVFSIIAFYAKKKNINRPKFGQWKFSPLLLSKNLMALCTLADFPLAY